MEFRRVLFFFQAEDGIRDSSVTGVQTCALFFSSRRRHTRFKCDWSSDVCSSDLVDDKAAVRGDVVLPVRNTLGRDARLKHDPGRPRGPGSRIKTYRDQFSIRLNEKNLPAILAPTGLGGSSRRDLYTPTRSTKRLHENSTPRSHVHDPLSVRREFGFYSFGSKWLYLMIAWGVDRQGRKRMLIRDGHKHQAAVWRPILRPRTHITLQKNLRRLRAVGGDLIAVTSYTSGAVRNLLPIAGPHWVVLVAGASHTSTDAALEMVDADEVLALMPRLTANHH